MGLGLRVRVLCFRCESALRLMGPQTERRLRNPGSLFRRVLRALIRVHGSLTGNASCCTTCLIPLTRLPKPCLGLGAGRGFRSSSPDYLMRHAPKLYSMYFCLQVHVQECRFVWNCYKIWGTLVGLYPKP